MPLLVPPDSSTLAALVNAITSAQPLEAGALLAEFEGRYPSLPWKLLLSGSMVGGSGSARQEWLGLIRAGRAFSNAAFLAAAAGAFNFVQLFNPAGSGKRLLVYAAHIESGISQEMYFTTENVERLNNNATANLLAGGAAAAAHFNTGNNANNPNTGTGFAGGGVLDRAVTPISTPYYANSPLGFVCELPEGFGLDCWGGTVNTDLRAGMAWAEVPTSGYQ